MTRVSEDLMGRGAAEGRERPREIGGAREDQRTGDGIDRSVLVSLIVVASHGEEGWEASARVARTLQERFAFLELLIIGPASAGPVDDILRRLGPVAPQLRVLLVEGSDDFDRLATHGYQESIGDLIILSSADEINENAVDTILDRLLAGDEIVRLRRRSASAFGRAGSLLVRSLTGHDVDTRFLRTLGLNRQILSELLATPEEIQLFRFTSRKIVSRQTVIDVDQGQTRFGAALLLRRIDLVARLVATAAPRLLRMAAALCLILSLVAFATLGYVVAVWLFRDEIAEGWTTMISLLASWMFIQLGATSALCLGLSRLLDRQDRVRLPRLVDEMTISDMFAQVGHLNVETGYGAAVAHELSKRTEGGSPRDPHAGSVELNQPEGAR